MTLRNNQTAFTWMLAEFLLWCRDNGYEITLGEVYRTEEQQVIHMKAGRSKTMKSKHRERLAADLNLFINGQLATVEQYRPLGEKWEQLGGTWGGRFGVKTEEYALKIGWDAGHIEYKEVV